MERERTLAIIGGGAAGLAAAVVSARILRAAKSNARVVVFEKDDRVGRSILATGNGRCNFSNACVTSSLYHNESFVDQVFSAAGENSVLSLFESCGLAWREEARGRLFPVTGKASTVLDVLRASACAYGVEERCDNAVGSIELPRDQRGCFTLRMADGVFERADAVIVAVGGKAGCALLPDKVSLATFKPVLGALKTNVEPIKALDNIRVRCAVTVRRAGAHIAREEGELLFRKYGVSGIAVFDVSRFALPGDELSIDFLPCVAEGDAVAYVQDRRARLRESGLTHSCGDVLRGLLLPLVADAVCAAAGVSAGDHCDDAAAAKIARCLKDFVLYIEGIADPRQCQVHRGGVRVDAIDASTLTVAGCAGLHVAGEMIDVDAPCGGYNLHWAWATGIVAAISAANEIL